MRIEQIWRYPVKSLQGERLTAVDLDETGVPLDRGWGLQDTENGTVLSAKRVPQLFFGAARITPSGALELELPEGESDLTSWLGRDVRLRRATAGDRGTFEIHADFEDEAGSDVIAWEGPAGSFKDSRPVHVLARGDLRGWDVRRFRPNLVLDGWDGELAPGHRLRFGAQAVLEVLKPTSRCVMTTRAQPGGVERDLDVLRTIVREQHGDLGWPFGVVTPGRITVGDEVARA